MIPASIVATILSSRVQQALATLAAITNYAVFEKSYEMMTEGERNATAPFVPASSTNENITTNTTGVTFPGAESTCLRESQPNNNYFNNAGINSQNAVGSFGSGDRTHIILKFTGLSSLAQGGTVSNGKIRLKVKAVDGAAPISVFPLLTPFVASEATWNNKSTGVAWQTAGAIGAADKGATALFTTATITSGLVDTYVEFSGAAVDAYIQDAIANPSTHYGFYFQVQNDTAYNGQQVFFYGTGGSGSVDGNRPELTFTYAVAASGGVDGGIPAFAVSKASSESPSYQIHSSATENGTYTLDADNVAYTPSALINGLISYDHRTLTVSDEIDLPVSFTPNTVGLIADSAGQKEIVLLNDIETTTIGGSTIKDLKNVGVAAHYSVPITVGQNDTARLYPLTSYGQDPTARPVGLRYYKLAPKNAAGEAKPLSEITAIPVSIVGYRNMPNPPKGIRAGISASYVDLYEFPASILPGNTYFGFKPSSKDDATPTSFFNASGVPETGVAYKVGVQSTDGTLTPIRTLTLDNTTGTVLYSVSNRISDGERQTTDYTFWAEKAGVKSLPFTLPIIQGVQEPNTVETVALTQVSSTVKALVTLNATNGGFGNGTERNIYLIQLSGTLLANINLTSITVSAGVGAELLEAVGDGTSFYVQTGDSLVSFELTIPYTSGVGNSLIVKAGNIDDFRTSNTITIV